jgi:NADPH2:quinone reductase
LRVLVTGASGGVGHYVTELAAAAGAAVTVLTGSPGRGEPLLSLGALAALRDIQEVRGPFDVVFESVGGESLSGALRLLMPHGKLMWFGQVSCKAVELDFFSYFAQTGARSATSATRTPRSQMTLTWRPSSVSSRPIDRTPSWV